MDVRINKKYAKSVSWFSVFLEFVFYAVDEEQMDTSEKPDDSCAADHGAAEPDFTENSKPPIYLSKTTLVVP